MTYTEAEAFLLALPRFTDQGAAAYRPGLERITALLEAMERPHEAYDTVHVAGTNGKGSTASLLAAVAAAAGWRTGLHTSPHLYHLAERMRVDGVPADEAWLAGAVARYREAMAAVRPSFFEATVALSFRYFAECGVRLAVVEVGLGGRLDATNVLHPRLALITNIGLEHTELLGTTHAAIAREKAGIIKPGVPLLTTATRPDVLDVFRRTAAACDAPFHHVPSEVVVDEVASTPDGLRLRVSTPVRRYDALEVGLPGLHQQQNALLALRAAELLPGLADDPAPVRAGLQGVRRLAGLRGRLEVRRRAPLVVADVAHNADGLAAALAFVGPHVRARGGRLFVLFGVMRDKDLHAMATQLRDAGASVFPVFLAGERALPAGELAGVLAAYNVSVASGGSLPDGLAWFERQATSSDALLITGSHLLVAQLPDESGRVGNFCEAKVGPNGF